MSYVYIFLQSNVLEWCIYLPFLKSVRPDWNWRERAALITAMNAITHPIVFFGIMNLHLPYLADILLAETFAVAAEAAILTMVLKGAGRPATIASLIANLISWQLAPMLTYALWAR